MKKSFVLSLFGLFLCLGVPSFAKAATGPYYLYWNGTCHIVEAYLEGDNLYGKEIGCGGPHSIIGGGLTGSSSASLGYDYDGDPRVYEYAADGTVTIYQNSGIALTYFNSGTWSLGVAPAAADFVAAEQAADPNGE